MADEGVHFDGIADQLIDVVVNWHGHDRGVSRR
jgi:hypothetical protein